MDINSAFPSTYLKKEDFPQPTLMTIRGVKTENVAPDGQPEERKPVMFFNEKEQGLVLNRTNASILVSLAGSETDEWPGTKIVVYEDPNISFGGKLVGGIRLRAPAKQRTSPNAQAAQAGADDGSFDDLNDPSF